MRCTLYILCCLCGAVLLVPGAAPVAVAQEAAGEVYTVNEGDTLYGVARRHGLTVAQLRRLNGLEGTTIYPGQQLRVRVPEQSAGAQGSAPPPPDTAAAGTNGPVESAGEEPPAAPGAGAPLYGSHTAEARATFYTIAARYGTSVDSLAALNRSAGTFLEAGEKLRLPVALGPPAHTVEAGETIYDVAGRYGVSTKLLQRMNDLESKEVREGQRLRIPGREAPAPQPRGTRRSVRFSGPVARYPASYEGRLMAGGTRYDPEQYVVSHPSLPIGTVVLLTNPAAGQQTFAQVADRGPLDEQYVMDVSAVVHERLGLAEDSSQPVKVRVMD